MIYWVEQLFVIILLGMVITGPAKAVDTLTAEELASHCVHYAEDPDSKDGIFCLRYIQGIDGAVATDERVTLNVAAEYQKEETWIDRAVRTRLGSRLNRYGPSFYAEFCLGAPVPLADVVNQVVTSLQDGQSLTNISSARELVYLELRRHYPCKPDTADANSQ